MRSKFILSAALTLFCAAMTAQASIPKGFSVSAGISGDPVNIFSLDPPRILEERFDPKKLTQAFLVLEISGTFEGNLCADNAVGFERRFNADHGSANVAYDLYLKPIKTDSDTFNLEASNCFSFSKPSPFHSRMKLALNSWSDTWQERTWDYRIRDPRNAVKVLRIKFSRTEGWKVEFRDP